ncbi:hypothetical protein OXX79_003510 [Metschnikowia pulcherrima]
MSSGSQGQPHGLSPAKYNSRENSHASIWKPYRSRGRLIPADEFDDEAEITTPNSVRETTRAFAPNGTSPKNNSSIFVRRESISDLPQTPTRNGGSDRSRYDLSMDENEPITHTAGPVRANGGSAKRSAPDMSPKHKLVSDTNTFMPDPSLNSLSPPRNSLSMFKEASQNREDMEFDPSDYESPEKRDKSHKSRDPEMSSKRHQIHNIASDAPASSRPVNGNSGSAGKPGLPAGIYPEVNFDIDTAKSKPSGLAPKLRPEEPARTPRMSSPLRHEVLPSSSNRSTASSMIDEIRKSGVLQPRSVQDIQDQIHSSMRELEQSESRNGYDSHSVSESESSDSQEESDGEKALSKLGDILQSEFGQVFDQDEEPNDRNSSPVLIREPESSPTANSPSESHVSHANGPIISPTRLETISSNSSPVSRAKRSRLHPTGKLSGKYARKRVRDNKQRPTRKYTEWSYEQWDKLRRLVDSSVPNSVIAGSDIVMRELRCSSKQELAQRVAFLAKAKK